MNKVLIIIFSIFLFISCVEKKEKHSIDYNLIKTESPKYAKGFNIEYYDEFQVINIFNPWKENEIQEKIFVTTSDDITFPPKSIVIKSPLKKIAITSCTHIEFINLLGEVEKIKGVCSPELIYNNTIQQLYKEKKITNLGDAFNINIEQLLNLNPDGIMLATYNKQDNNTQRLEHCGIKLLYNNEWTESSLLGRAEWIKYFGILFDKKAEADCILFKRECN